MKCSRFSALIGALFLVMLFLPFVQSARAAGCNPAFKAGGYIGAQYAAFGGPQSALGCPTSNEMPLENSTFWATARPNGRTQTFQHGSITWYPSLGPKMTLSLWWNGPNTVHFDFSNVDPKPPLFHVTVGDTEGKTTQAFVYPGGPGHNRDIALAKDVIGKDVRLWVYACTGTVQAPNCPPHMHVTKAAGAVLNLEDDADAPLAANVQISQSQIGGSLANNDGPVATIAKPETMKAPRGFVMTVTPPKGPGRTSKTVRFATSILPRMNRVRDLPPVSRLNPLSQYISSVSGPAPHNTLVIGSNPNNYPKIDGGPLPYIQPGFVPVYPGELVHGSIELLDSGQVAELKATGATGTVTVNALFSQGSPSRRVVDNLGDVSKKMQQIMNQPFSADQLGQSLVCNAHQITSSDDANWAINASASYLTASISDSLSVTTSSSSNQSLLYCTHDYFTATYEPDPVGNLALLSAYFDPSVTVNQLKTALSAPNDVPMVVDKVTYGSQLIILFSSQSSSSTLANDLQAMYGAGAGTASVNLQTKISKELKDSTCQFIADGGRASTFTNATGPSCNGGNVMAAIAAYEKGEADIAASRTQSQAVGVPIGYYLSYLDGFPASMYANAYGPEKPVSDQYLTNATVQFHQDGDGKDYDTTVDMYLVDADGDNVASVSIPTNSHFADNGDSPTYTFKFINPNVKILRENLDGGVFRMVIHPNGHDTWNYTAHLAFTYADSKGHVSKDIGQASNMISQDNPERIQSFSDYFGSFDRSTLPLK